MLDQGVNRHCISRRAAAAETVGIAPSDNSGLLAEVGCHFFGILMDDYGMRSP